jgi:hypothetical protein
MKKLLLMVCCTLLSCFGYTQLLYTVEQFKKTFGCDPDETVSECKTRLRNTKISRQDSIKREKEWREYEIAKKGREERERERQRRDKLTPEERAKEDEQRRLAFEASKKKKVEEEIDFTAGAIFSTKTGQLPSYNSISGLLIGVQAQVLPFADHTGLVFGINYSMQGGKYESSEYIPGGNYGKSSRTSRLNYLNFPVLFRYRKARHGFFAEAGVQPGLLLSAKDKGTTTTDIKDEVKKFDVGIPVGAGYKFKNKFGVGLRIIPGLININKDEQYKNRNLVGSLSATYSL